MELHHLGIEETFKILKISINTISTGHALIDIYMHDHNYLLTISSFLFTIDSMQKNSSWYLIAFVSDPMTS